MSVNTSTLSELLGIFNFREDSMISSSPLAHSTPTPIRSLFGHESPTVASNSSKTQNNNNMSSYAISPLTLVINNVVNDRDDQEIPLENLDELIMRFLMHIPQEEKHPVRAIFQIELAHWFFVDFYCCEGAELRPLATIPFEKFAKQIFQRTPFLKKYLPKVDDLLNKFRIYKAKVPTFGAILLDETMTNVLLVQGFRSQWGFPKGKVNKSEDPVHCAIREVREETGYGMEKLVNRKHFIEHVGNDRRTRLYIVTGVPLSFPFSPQTRFEIKNIGWFPLKEMPENKRDPSFIPKKGLTHTHFFSVYPFAKRLKYWVHDKLIGIHKIDNFKSRNIEWDSNLFYNLMELPVSSPSSQKTQQTTTTTGTTITTTANNKENNDITITLSPKMTKEDFDKLLNLNVNGIGSINGNGSIKIKQQPLSPHFKETPNTIVATEQLEKLLISRLSFSKESSESESLPFIPQPAPAPTAALFTEVKIIKKIPSNSGPSLSFSTSDIIKNFRPMTCSTWANFKLDREQILFAMKQ